LSKLGVLALGLCVLASSLSAAPLTSADRTEVVANAARLLETRYVDPGAGKRLARRLRASQSRWTAIDDPKMFAEALTEWLRSEGRDGHLGITYSEAVIPDEAGDSVVSAAETEKWYGAHLNHGLEKIERLQGNIMLLDLRVFPPPDVAGDVIAAAMNITAQGDALIIDLRQNGGGSSETVSLIAGFLLDKPQQPLTGTYDRPTNTHHASASPSWVPGRRFGGTKPLYVLTSKRTFSAAEALAYDLQALKRAVIVGERTGGGAHPYEYRRVHPHFALDLPEGESVNPITGGNWQSVGVRPDVEVPAEQALELALKMASERVFRGRSGAASDPRSLP
jgi:hypothetical protein